MLKVVRLGAWWGVGGALHIPEEVPRGVWVSARR